MKYEKIDLLQGPFGLDQQASYGLGRYSQSKIENSGAVHKKGE
jgi:hypothetical protein